MHAVVHAADIQDRDGGVPVMATLFGADPFLLKLYADGGDPDPQFQAGLARVMRNVGVEIVKRSDTAKGFAVLPKRRIVERTIAWLNRCRRLAEDWECLNRRALAVLRLHPSASCCESRVEQWCDPGCTLGEAGREGAKAGLLDRRQFFGACWPP